MLQLKKKEEEIDSQAYELNNLMDNYTFFFLKKRKNSIFWGKTIVFLFSDVNMYLYFSKVDRSVET